LEFLSFRVLEFHHKKVSMQKKRYYIIRTIKE